MVETQFQPDWFSKPGDTLLTMMEHRELTCEDLAVRIGRSPASIRGLIAGAVEIDEYLSEQLSRHVGGNPTFWQRRQASYKSALSRAAQAVPKESAEEWVKQFPHRDICDYGWIERHQDRHEVLKAYLAYFGVNSPKEWKERYLESFGTAFRTSPSFKSRAGALSAWLRRGEVEASSVHTEKWASAKLKGILPELRSLIKSKTPAYFLPRLRKMCATAGIAVVFVRAPSGCHASGATRFITPSKAMVILSFRHLSEDHFWFTFFHELGHVLLHSNSMTFIESDLDKTSHQEQEANKFAEALLVPPERKDELLDLRLRKDSVIRFAVSIGISPGVVVGQLQHNKVIKPSQLNFLKRRFNWEEIASVLPNLENA